MLHGSQKRFDKDGDGKLSMHEWERWYWYSSGMEEAERARRTANAAAEQKRAEIAEGFASRAANIINWMYHDLEHLEGEREDQSLRTMHLALYVISAALQTQVMDDSLRYLLRAFWAHFQPTLRESVYQGLCAKQILFEEIGAIKTGLLGSFWMELLYRLPPERRVGKDADLQELLDDTSRLYNYFRNDGTPEMDYAAALEPYWAKIRLPEDAEESDADEEEPDEDTGSEEAELQPDVPEQNGYYTFCMVQFTDGGASYAYLTGGIPLKAGDFVIVPAGKYDKERLGRVTDVFVCAAQDAPYPPEKTKFVLRKAEQTAFPEKKPAKREAQPAQVQVAKKESASTPPAAETPVPTQPVAENSEPEASKTVPAPESPTKKRCVPWGWLIAAAAVAAFVIFALPPLKRTAEAQRQKVIALQAEQKAEREREAKRAEERRLAEEAARQRQQKEREAALQAEKDAGIPYVGMPESSIDATRTLGVHGMAKSGWAYKKNGTFQQMTYYWYTSNRTPIFTAVCQDGAVIETQKIDGYWSGNTLLMPVIKPDIPTTFHSGSSNSGSIRDDYDNPEDLYEDNPWDYEDEDEAWDEWENDW